MELTKLYIQTGSYVWYDIEIEMPEGGNYIVPGIEILVKALFKYTTYFDTWYNTITCIMIEIRTTKSITKTTYVHFICYLHLNYTTDLFLGKKL